MTGKSMTAAGDEQITGRIALGLSYKGSRFYGWQAQPDADPSVQGTLEAAISKVANHPVSVVCAGRTDKAVHASYQVVHFDTHAQRSERAWVFGCNANLPPDISVSWAAPVSSEFHARFSAFNRRYNYLIYNHPVRPAHFYDEMTWCHTPLDADKMHTAAQSLLGEHDFTSFRAVGCQSRTPIREIQSISVERYADVLVIDVQGNAFLHHMVRNIAGVLISIGAGRQPVSWCKDVLEARDRAQADVTAPPYGLFLMDVGYPSEFALPASSGAPSIVRSMLAAGASPALCGEAAWSLSRKVSLD